jgi:polyhydroxyalkanoate synthase
MGNIPGELLNWTFLSLKPFSLTGQKYINMVDLLDDPDKVRNFLRMEKWIFDSPDQAGETFRQFIKDFYQHNGFINGGVLLGDDLVDLKRITCPVLNIFAMQDHLVPPDASKALQGLTSTSDYTELAFPGGHIGIYVSGKAQKEVTPAIGQWLNERS